MVPNLNTEFETSIAYMERLRGVFAWESCVKIHSYLTIFGKLQASEINKLVNLKGKSVYRSLKRLIDAGMVEKELEDESNRNAYYFIIGEYVRDPDFTPDFIEYLIKKDKYSLIADYLTAANQASMGFLQVATDIMKKRIDQTQDATVGTRFIDNSAFFEVYLSTDNPKLVNEKIQKFIKTELKPHIHQKYNPTEGIDNPAAFYLAFIPLGGQ